MAINVGDVARLTGTFKVGDALTDPTTVDVRYRPPGGAAVITQAAVRLSAGVYRLEVSVDRPGVWTYAFIGHGTCEAAEDGTFSVVNPRV